MTGGLRILACGPGLSVQDGGRPGYLAFGLSRGGAADRLALAEGSALLGQSPDSAAVEMAGSGGTFEATGDLRIALTGAPMRADLDGRVLAWNASHRIAAGQRLTIGGAREGVYGYLHLGGGVATEPVLGSRALHSVAGLGSVLVPGDLLPAGRDGHTDRRAERLEVTPRFSGGTIRVLATPQTPLFGEAELARFAATDFPRAPQGNRMGVKLDTGERGFAAKAGLSVLSEIVVPGDIQITGDGSPFILLAECQTTGGYPRIGTVIPMDLPRVAQTRPGTVLRFAFIDMEDALTLETAERTRRARFSSAVQPLVRAPQDIADLLAYQLIGGVTAGDDLDRPDANQPEDR